MFQEIPGLEEWICELRESQREHAVVLPAELEAKVECSCDGYQVMEQHDFCLAVNTAPEQVEGEVAQAVR